MSDESNSIDFHAINDIICIEEIYILVYEIGKWHKGIFTKLAIYKSTILYDLLYLHQVVACQANH